MQIKSEFHQAFRPGMILPGPPPEGAPPPSVPQGRDPVEGRDTLVQAKNPRTSGLLLSPAGDRVRVSDERTYDPENPQTPTELVEAKRQSSRADNAPGKLIARQSDGGKNGIRQIRERHPVEPDIPVVGLTLNNGQWHVPNISNPGTADGTFDALQWAPNFVFSKSEDSFPVPPDLDGDGQTGTDVEHYDHGVIGGKQKLQGAVSVAQKGEYTVVTYSMYFVDNKFKNYHRRDSATAAVYLLPGKDGTLKPSHLYTSWHYGGRLTPWNELQKGADGRPVIRVERGSHALHPYGQDEKIPSTGLHIRGDGTTALAGEEVGQAMAWVTPQSNIRNAHPLDLSNPADARAMDTYYRRYPERTHPIHPILFE